MSAQNKTDCLPFTYSIPSGIKERIPEYFYVAMAGELCSLYGPSVFVPDEDGIREYVYHEGTFGWSMALWMACKKCDQKWLADYYDQLEWCDADRFDGEIGDEIEAMIVGRKWNGGSYYQYLHNYEAEERCGYHRWME